VRIGRSFYTANNTTESARALVNNTSKTISIVAIYYVLLIMHVQMPSQCQICGEVGASFAAIVHVDGCTWQSELNSLAVHQITRQYYAAKGTSHNAKSAIQMIDFVLQDPRFEGASLSYWKDIDRYRERWRTIMTEVLEFEAPAGVSIRYESTGLQIHDSPIIYLNLQDEITSLLMDPAICVFDIDDDRVRFATAPDPDAIGYGEMFNAPPQAEMAQQAVQRCYDAHPEYTGDGYMVIPVGVIASSDGTVLDKMNNCVAELTWLSLSNIASNIRGKENAWRLHSAMQPPPSANIPAANPLGGTAAGRAHYTARRDVGEEVQRVRQEAMRIAFYEQLLALLAGFVLQDDFVPDALKAMYPGVTIVIVPFLAALICDLLGRSNDLCLKSNATTRFETPFNQLSAVHQYSADPAVIQQQLGPVRDAEDYNQQYLTYYNTALPVQQRRDAARFLSDHGCRLTYPWLMMLQHLTTSLVGGIYGLVGT
jgi:hypothetical protein